GVARQRATPFFSRKSAVSIRQRLPNRRPALSFEIEVDGQHFTVTIGKFADGALAEIFIQNSKPGSASDIYMRDAAIAASLALQHNCPLETLRRALLRDPRGNASTPLERALDLISES